MGFLLISVLYLYFCTVHIQKINICVFVEAKMQELYEKTKHDISKLVNFGS